MEKASNSYNYLISKAVLNSNIKEIQEIINTDLKSLRKGTVRLNKTSIHAVYAKLRKYMVFGMRNIESNKGPISATPNCQGSTPFFLSILPSINDALMGAAFTSMVVNMLDIGDDHKTLYAKLDPKDNGQLERDLNLVLSYAIHLLTIHQMIKTTVSNS